ncbi:MAG: hypothetical protein HY718_00010, partial [Planctomycetes bacterium]|nr:hypothetical protein [Planctomycetota bacterium]
ELLGQPCRAKQILGSCIVTDRHDGRERLVLMNDNEAYGCELLYIDYENDKGRMFPAPAGAGSWTVIEVPGDRLVIGTFYDGAFMIFDLQAMKFIKAVKFPGEQYIWNLVLGKDGRVYGGTYPGGKLGALDLETYEVEDLGAPTKPNQYLRYVSAAPWGEIFANFGMIKSTTKAFDIETKSWRDVPDLKEGQQVGRGFTWNGAFIAADPRSGRTEAFVDASLVSPKESVLASAEFAKYSPNANLSDDRTLYLQRGRELYRLRADAKEFAPTKVADVDLRGGSCVAVSGKDELIGLRGQSYFVVRPGETQVKFRPIPVESRGREPLFLKADDQGRVWGGPHFGQTLFHYDIATGKAVNTDAICDAGGEVYDATFFEGRVYAASYSGGDITCYDPAEPWDQINHKNPRPVAKVAPAYIRPVGGIVVGPDNRLYAGWMAKYGAYGGAVSITDPATGKTELIENPFGSQAISAIAVDAKCIYAGTSRDGNGLPHQKGPVHFGVIDIASRKVVFDKPLDAASIARLVIEPKSGLVAFKLGPRLYVYDAKAGTVSADPIPGLPNVTARAMVAVGDGTLLTACGNQICQLDLAKKTYAVLTEVPEAPESMTVASDGRVYFNHEADLYRTREPLAKLR